MSDEIIAPRCPNCGDEGPTSGKSFCEVCGDFVDWDEVVRKEAAARAAAAAAAPKPEIRLTLPIPESPVAPAAPSPPPPAAPPPAAPPSPEPSSVAAPAQPAAAGSTGAGRRRRTEASPENERESMWSRARALLVPLREREPEVAPVLPGRPEPRRPEVRTPMATEESGITCWNCGWGNRSDRRFCRNCGVDLRDVPAPPPPQIQTFWERLRAWLRRHLRALIALAVVILLLLIALLVYLLLLNRGDETLLQLPPAEVAASQSDPEHPAVSAFDGVQDSWWGPGQRGGGAGQYLYATYKRPIELHAIRIIPGVSPRPQDRDQQNRPQLIDVTVEDASGHSNVFRLRLRDGGVQDLAVEARGAVRVTLTVRSAYVSGRDRQLAIAEVQLFGRAA
jgi:hypothetical protein